MDVVEARLWVESKLAGVKELEQLSNYPNKYIRRLICSNPNCTLSIAQKLLKDEDKNVVKTAEDWILAKSKNLQ